MFARLIEKRLFDATEIMFSDLTAKSEAVPT